MAERAESFGRYEIVGVLGRGGFSTVYRVRDPQLDRQVALKTLLPHLAEDETVRTRFLSEARSIARLSHPSIITIYEAGEVDGRAYYTMELINGRTLAQELNDGVPLQAGRMLEILHALASAIDYLHGAGIVHRDIKPANVMLGRDERVVLMDFGIARVIDDSQLTNSGAVMGTPAYMSPEQVLGERVSSATDIYSFAVMAYQMLGGRLPFVGPTASMLHAQAYEPAPPLGAIRPELPSEVCRAIDAALAKDPADRPASAMVLSDQLRTLTDGLDGWIDGSLATTQALPALPSTEPERSPTPNRRPSDQGPQTVPMPHRRPPPVRPIIPDRPDPGPVPGPPIGPDDRKPGRGRLLAAGAAALLAVAVVVGILFGLRSGSGGNSSDGKRGAASATSAPPGGGSAVAQASGTALPPSSTATAQGGGPLPASPAPSAAATSVPAVAPTGELRLAADDPLTLDPALATDTNSAAYLVEIFGGLVQLDKQLNVIPDIAREMPQISPEGTTYTFKLRDDVVFQTTNRKVTAQDVKYSIERAASPDTGSSIAAQYLGDIVGARDMISGRAKSISGLRVIDDQTLQIQLDAAKPYFLKKLTYPTSFVVDRQQVEADKQGWTRAPHGTGPFRLKEWKPGESLTLVANDRYHLGVPKIAQVTYSLNGGVSVTQYENGQLDIAGVGNADIDRVRDPKGTLAKEFTSKPDLATYYIAFNLRLAPFDDVRVRQAFSEAIDRKQLATIVLKSTVQQSDGILPPGMPGFNANLKGLPFNPQQAKLLIQQSKYAGKLPVVTLTTSGQGADIGPYLDAIIQMWKDNLGVTVQVRQIDNPTFSTESKQGKYQAWDGGWQADYPDPENFLDLLFHSQSNSNDWKYSNSQVDNLLVQARTEGDPAKRTAEYQQAEQQIVNDAPWAPLFHTAAPLLIKPYVQGYDPPGAVIPILRYVSLNK